MFPWLSTFRGSEITMLKEFPETSEGWMLAKIGLSGKRINGEGVTNE